jgi:hypothetical protein
VEAEGGIKGQEELRLCECGEEDQVNQGFASAGDAKTEDPPGPTCERGTTDNHDSPTHNFKIVKILMVVSLFCIGSLWHRI